MRPAFFGEVVLPASRAVDVDFGDDFEEDVPKRYELVLEIRKDIKTVLPTVKYLVLGSGFHPSNFAKVYLIPQSPEPEVAFSVKVLPCTPRNDGDDQRPIPISVLDFLHVPKTNSLVGITASKYAPTPDVATAVVNKIFEHLAPIASTLTIFVLDFKPSALYQAYNRSLIEDRLATGLIRVLMSSKQMVDNKDNFLQLEAPNMIDGLAAAVMTHCELNGIRAMVIGLYGPDSGDAISSNISIYRASLERATVWKSLFLCQESETVIQSKLAVVARKSIPLTSVFG